MPDYRYVGSVAGTAEIGDKSVPLAPGDFVTMSGDEYKQATEEGLQLMEIPQVVDPEVPTAELTPEEEETPATEPPPETPADEPTTDGEGGET